MRPLAALCRLGLGRQARAAGDLPAAQAELETAAALLRALAMPFWLGQASAEASEPG